MLCHGNPDGDHCCWVNGVQCPNLLAGQQVADAVQAQVTLYNFKGPANNLASRIGDGIQFACHVAIKVIAAEVNTNKAIPSRAAFEAAWTAHPDYQPIADYWESIGQGRDWCPKYGPAEGQCCFSETETTNTTKAAGIPVTVRNLRNAIGGA